MNKVEFKHKCIKELGATNLSDVNAIMQDELLLLFVDNIKLSIKSSREYVVIFCQNDIDLFKRLNLTERILTYDGLYEGLVQFLKDWPILKEQLQMSDLSEVNGLLTI